MLFQADGQPGCMASSKPMACDQLKPLLGFVKPPVLPVVVCLTFFFKGDECVITYRRGKLSNAVPVGMNGKHIITAIRSGTTCSGSRSDLPFPEPDGADFYRIAFLGSWFPGNKFMIEWLNYPAEPSKFTAVCSFSDDEVNITQSIQPSNRRPDIRYSGKIVR